MGPASQRWRSLTVATIPMARDIESLNAAVAAGALLFEIARRRPVSGAHRMKIRAITVFADLGPPLEEAQIACLGSLFAQHARHTKPTDLRCRPPVGRLYSRLRLSDWANRSVEFVVALEHLCQKHGFEYVSLGPAGRDAWPQLPKLLGAARSTFASILITDPATGAIDGDAIWGAARVIRETASVEVDGFANLRFAALANVQPGTPFFPAAYCDGGPPSFALATEAADLAMAECTDARDAEVARWRLAAVIQKQAEQPCRCVGA
jgi:hypothetical protein